MNASLGLIQQGLFFGFIITFLVALLSRSLYPILQKPLSQLDPSLQSSLVSIWSVLPILSSLVIIFLALLPSMLQIIGLSSDHCLGHTEGHIHFCLIHTPAPINSLAIWIPAVIYLLALFMFVLNILVDVCETARFRVKLDKLVAAQTDKDISILDTDTPLALSCGLFKQRIFLSTGLLNSLSKEEQDIIIAHERAHIRRWDSLKKLLARSFSLAHFPITRSLLLKHLTLVSEQACDNAAVKKHDDNSKLAELLLKIERLYQGHFFTSSSLASNVLDQQDNILMERVQHLLSNQDYPPLTAQLIIVTSVFSLTLLLGHDFIHDILEHLMYVIAGTIR